MRGPFRSIPLACHLIPVLLTSFLLVGCEATAVAHGEETHRREDTRELSEHAGGSDLFSARSHNGSITVVGTDGDRVEVVALPIRVQGKIRKNRLEGAIGEGDGELVLRTHNGSVRLR